MRNPFRLRAAQRSVSDEQFVKLFGGGAFDLLDELKDPWGGLVFLRSAPGGGKTSFLRLLTPRPLKLASHLHDVKESRLTYDALRERGAIDNSGPRLLGVMAAFTNEYQDIEEIDVAGGMFRALVNARIVIATVRAVLDRSDRAYPDDLNIFKAKWSPDTEATIPANATGRDLYEWASEIERDFYTHLDELGETGSDSFGHTRLDALTWFAKAEFYDAHGPINSKRVLLLDDLQFLSTSQRRSLKHILTNAGESCGIWVAERMEALSHQEILSEGALRERSYHGVIQLENKWAGRLPAYMKFVGQIAELRARSADGFEGREIFPLIAEEDDADWDEIFDEASRNIKAKLQKLTSTNPRYKEWIATAEDSPGSSVERARRWRATEILIERDIRRVQTSFEFETLANDDFTNRVNSALIKAADLFLRNEISAPLYFGKETLAAVSSSNVDQYIEVTGDIFEEISAKVSGPRATPAPLKADRQHSIIKQTAKSRWDELPRRLPQGYDARRFLSAVGEFCRTQTYRPTAPYAPGVTGFAVTMKERARMIDFPDDDPSPFAKLRNILTSLVAHNLLAPRLDHKNKGREYVVFYLNRLICVHFDLPLGYGGWREKSLNELVGWIEHGRGATEERRLLD